MLFVCALSFAQNDKSIEQSLYKAKTGEIAAYKVLISLDDLSSNFDLVRAKLYSKEGIYKVSLLKPTVIEINCLEYVSNETLKDLLLEFSQTFDIESRDRIIFKSQSK